MCSTGALIPTIEHDRVFHWGHACAIIHKRAHPDYQNIFHSTIDSYYIMGYSPDQYETNRKRYNT